MKIHIYSLAWNDSQQLPFYLRHYQPIVDRFFIFDDGSTDGSMDILRPIENVEVHSFDKNPASFVRSAQEVNNHAW